MPTPPADDIVDLYERNAAAWDEDRRHRRPDGELDWINRFASQALPDLGILDLGCGSGEPIVPDLLATGHRVVGVDSAPSLVALCRRRFPGQHWLVADMRALDLGRAFGGIVAWHCLFHLTPAEQARMFPILARHLAPGAPLMFTSGSQAGETIGSWRGEPLYHASLDLAEYENLLARNGFALIERVVGDARCGGATIWIAQRAPA